MPLKNKTMKDDIFICHFNPPLVMTDEPTLEQTLLSMYKDNVVPVFMYSDHSLIDEMNQRYPQVLFERVLVYVRYDKPFIA
jgi:hypothetical protein